MTVVSTSPEDDDAGRRWNRRCGAIHRIKLSHLYHLKRERHFDSVDRFITAATAITATTAAATLYKTLGEPGEKLGVWLTAGAAVLSVASFTYVPAVKARLHGQIASNMRRLWADCLKAGEAWTHELCDDFESRALLEEEGEPAQLGALVAQCENEIAVSVDHLEGVRVRGWWRKLLMHWCDFDTTYLKPLSAEKIKEMRQRVREA